MPIHAERRHRWDYGPGLWGCCFGSHWRRPSRREETEALKDYIAQLKDELQDAEERLKDSNSRRPSQLAASRDPVPQSRMPFVAEPYFRVGDEECHHSELSGQRFTLRNGILVIRQHPRS